MKASEPLAQETRGTHTKPASMLQHTAVDPREQVAIAPRRCGVRTLSTDVDHQLAAARRNRTRHFDRRSDDLVGKGLEERQLGLDVFDGAVTRPVNPKSETKSTPGHDLEDGIVDEANRPDVELRREIVGSQRRTRDPQQRLV